jgi:hypothetical protein
MNKEPIQVKKSKDEILMQSKEEWSYVEHITPIQAWKNTAPEPQISVLC